MKSFYAFLFLMASGVCSAQEPLTLPQALEAARDNRAAIAAKRLSLAEARQLGRSAGAFPATRLLAGYTSEERVGGSDEDLVLVQPIDLFGRGTAAKRRARAAISRAEADLRLVQIDVQSEVISAFIDLAAATEALKSSVAIEALYEQLFEATRLRVEGGVAPGFHLARIELDLEQARLRREQRQSEERAVHRMLSTVIGTGVPGVSGFPDITFQPVSDKDLARFRPDLLLLSSEVEMAEAELGAARAEYRPEVEIQGRRSPWQDRGGSVGLRLQLSMPLMDFGRGRAEAKALTARIEAARADLADATGLAGGELESAITEAESARVQVARYEELVRKGRSLVERLRPGLTEQATTLIEVLDATRVLRDLEIAQVEAHTRLARAQARLLRASGQLLEVAR